MKRSVLLKLFVVGLGIALASEAWADTVVLKQGVGGYAGCSDTYIDHDNPTANNGSLWYMHLYMSSHNPRRSVPVRFDLTGVIPPGQIIQSATLSLWLYQIVSMNSGDWIYVGPYRIHATRSWSETGATWNCFTGSTYWGTAGCENTTWDRLGVEDSGLYFYDTSSVNCYYHWDVTASVQAWYGGVEGNQGWLVRIIEHDGGTDGISFNAKESTEAYRPYLTIVYAPQGIPVQRTSWGEVKNLFR